MAETRETSHRHAPRQARDATQDTAIFVDSGAWKVKVVLGTVGIGAVVGLAFVFRFEAGLIMLGLGLVVIWRGLVRISLLRRMERQKLRRMEAETRKLELETDIVAERLAQEREKTDELRLRKRIIETRVGVFRFPEAAAEPVYIPANVEERKLLAATGPVIEGEVSLDFCTVLSDPQAAYALIGPQRVGKSYLAMHLSDYLTSRGLGTCVVIGTKMEPGEWPNCRRFIGSSAIERALRRLVTTVEARHTQQVRSPRLNIFLDDWLNVVAVAGELAETFFLRAATDMLAAGVVPYFILQSDSNSDWGNKHGAQLKNNFTKLILKPKRVNGKVIPELTTGVILWPGERTEQPVTLPVGLPQLRGEAEAKAKAEVEAAEPVEPVGASRAKPTPREQIILTMWADGASFNQISKEINEGRTGGTYNEEIKQTLQKFGMRV